MRSPTDLPPDLRAALDRLAYSRSRRTIGVRAAAQSRHYRAGGASDPIATRDDALGYAFTRLPATYAAAVAVFDAMRETWVSPAQPVRRRRRPRNRDLRRRARVWRT